MNALCASLFVYKMLVLPYIPNEIVRTTEQIFQDFLWKGVKPKVAIKMLQKDKKSGGLNLVDLRNKDISLKVKWKAMLEQDSDYAITV